ncbi:uncharacterized protein LOC116847974 [Odontomachus brunneus]|uniref:uncharacterized protein LOC116847974 n=1 Tax=Odontomachus brunneus TaxID=486640 RepID=UPI0013F23D97|nr:uncharacterized protein LOC116847974 [Odontomachus brunneus]
MSRGCASSQILKEGRKEGIREVRRGYHFASVQCEASPGSDHQVPAAPNQPHEEERRGRHFLHPCISVALREREGADRHKLAVAESSLNRFPSRSGAAARWIFATTSPPQCRAKEQTKYHGPAGFLAKPAAHKHTHEILLTTNLIANWWIVLHSNNSFPFY